MKRSGIAALLITAAIIGIGGSVGWIATTMLQTPRGGAWAEEAAAGPFDWARWFLFTPSSEEVVEAFQREGLEVGFIASTGHFSQPCASGPGRTMYSELTAFEIPLAELKREKRTRGPEINGQVFVFTSRKDAAVLSLYNQPPSPPKGARGADRPKPYVYQEGLVLLCIDGRIPSEKAQEYYQVMSNYVVGH